MSRCSTDRRDLLKQAAGAGAAAAFGSGGWGDATHAAEVAGSRAADGAASAGRTALVLDAVFKKHRTGPSHPERPERIDAVDRGLREARLDERLVRLRPRRAEDAWLLACHGREYVATARRDVERGARQLSTGDTAISPDSLEVATLAAGGGLVMVDQVCRGKSPNGFCAIRPPGHHATPDRGMGFCVFNNAAVAARYAQKQHGIGKVVIVDWDVHHGNGTQDVFYDDGSVFYFSTHQSPWYPHTGSADETGRGKGKGTTLNCPFPAGSGRKEILGAFSDKLVEAMGKFKPELVIISAGFDSRRGDPLGGFTLSDDDFADLTKIMLTIAREHAEGRLVSVLEGGYDLDGLGRAAAAHVKALIEGVRE